MILFYTYALFIKYFKIMSSFFVKLFGEKRFVNSINVFPLNIKSINPIQKYAHITESFACILKMFVLMFLLLINILISFGICSTPKESKQVTFFYSHAKQPNESQYQTIHQDLIYTPHPLFFVNYLEKKHH